MKKLLMTMALLISSSAFANFCLVDPMTTYTSIGGQEDSNTSIYISCGSELKMQYLKFVGGYPEDALKNVTAKELGLDINLNNIPVSELENTKELIKKVLQDKGHTVYMQ